MIYSTLPFFIPFLRLVVTYRRVFHIQRAHWLVFLSSGHSNRIVGVTKSSTWYYSHKLPWAGIESLSHAAVDLIEWRCDHPLPNRFQNGWYVLQSNLAYVTLWTQIARQNPSRKRWGCVVEYFLTATSVNSCHVINTHVFIWFRIIVTNLVQYKCYPPVVLQARIHQ